MRDSNVNVRNMPRSPRIRDGDDQLSGTVARSAIEENSMRRKVIALAVLGAALMVAAPALAARSHQAAKSTTTITVTMTEFKFKLSKATAPKGTVIFKLANKGAVAHDFKINGKKSKLIGAKKSGTLTVKFAKAGKFAYLCTVPGHAAGGMKGSFTVKA
jgi:uncharacterized cupredoxin-like copper-binding protein